MTKRVRYAHKGGSHPSDAALDRVGAIITAHKAGKQPPSRCRRHRDTAGVEEENILESVRRCCFPIRTSLRLGRRDQISMP
jgi:hypothetical protein